MIQFFILSVSMFVFLGGGVQASDDMKDMEPGLPKGKPCVRFDSHTFLESLGVEEKASLEAGKQVTKFVAEQKKRSKEDQYEIGYVFKITKDFDPELIMSVFSQADQHAAKIGNKDQRNNPFILQSYYVNPYGNSLRPFPKGAARNPSYVFYEQQVDLLPNGKYIVENKVSKTSEGGYILESSLVKSKDNGFSPEWLDSYLMTVKYQEKTLVIACNYMQPRGDSFIDEFKNKARDRLTASGNNLLSWVKEVAKDDAVAEKYRNRLRALLNH